MKTDKIIVYYHDQKVGTLGLIKNTQQVAFQYDENWIKTGFSISPLSLPLTNEVFVPQKSHFNGLFGVFADSLPDAWGNILLNRVVRKHNLKLDELNILDRLAIIGNSGMGALTYKPVLLSIPSVKNINLDKIAEECHLILTSEYSENIDDLFKLGGSSGGARPKILTNIENEDWIIKFPAHTDIRDIGIMEYKYYQCALLCGIKMSQSKLFKSNTCKGYFGTKRFDRVNNKRIHMISVAALLETDFRVPNLDYHTFMKLTKVLTKNNPEDVEQMFRIMCFNVFAHNRDDHAKNFSYLYDETENRWHLSPAYDMTYSNTYYGEHSTTIDGNGLNPGKEELLNVGIKAGMNKNVCKKIMNDIQFIVNQELNEYIK